MKQTTSLLHSPALSYSELKLLAGLILDETDHYTVLGIDPKASLEEINQSYCLAVKHFHPLNHRTVVSSEPVMQWLLSCAFTRICIAYRMLSNPRRREVYDRSQEIGRDSPQNPEPVGKMEEYALNDEERLKLQSYSFATPEWLLAKQREKDALGKEHRRVMRVKIRIPVVVACENQWQETAMTCDLSPLGALLALTRPVEPGTLLRLQLRMPKQFRTRDYHSEHYMVRARALRTYGSQTAWMIAVEFI